MKRFLGNSQLHRSLQSQRDGFNKGLVTAEAKPGKLSGNTEGGGSSWKSAAVSVARTDVSLVIGNVV